MQVVENWADVVGRLVSTRPHPQLKGYVSATVDVSETKSVPGFPNLFEGSKGQRIEVNLQKSAVPGLESLRDGIISLRMRKAGPLSNFAEPL